MTDLKKENPISLQEDERLSVLIPYILAFGGEIKTHLRFEPANAWHINIIENLEAKTAFLRIF